MGNAIMDLSNLIWTEGAEPAYGENCVLLMQDFEHSFWKDSGAAEADMRYFLICCGGHTVEDGCTGNIPTYLAVRRQDGSYTLERVERYMEEREGRLVLDLLKLPGQIGGITLRRVASAQYPNYNRWRSGTFCRENSIQTWRLEEYN